MEVTLPISSSFLQSGVTGGTHGHQTRQLPQLGKVTDTESTSLEGNDLLLRMLIHGRDTHTDKQTDTEGGRIGRLEVVRVMATVMGCYGGFMTGVQDLRAAAKKSNRLAHRYYTH